MDPLAGLSLACNIMQVIQFSAETMAVFRRLNEGKSPDPYVEVNSQSLVAATERLKSTLNTRSVIHGVPRDASLLQVCNEVVLVADALHKHAQKSLPAKGESKTKLIRKSVAFQLKHRSATEKLSRQLDKLQHRMESEVLIDLRQTLKQDHSDLVDRLQALDKDLIDFRANLIAGQTRLEDLVDRESGEIKKTIADEAQKTRNYNSQSAQETRDFINATHKERINDTAYQQFLNSFRFVDINARRNTIEFSHPETFEWIFAEPEDSQSSDDVAPNWSSFPEWLRGGTGLYWISGKAGAGKSTLMKFLLESQRTRQILSENSPNTMVVSAFIWSLGSSMQKTLIGVLCTLLYDMFAQDRELCWCQFRGRQGEFHLKQESSDWSLQELVLLFSTVAENCPRPLCIFIDGLDEIDRSKPTEITRLMGWLESARNLKNLQLCVSSRPEPTFENRLQEHPHLRVQDLTAKDTERYVSDSLRGLESDLKASPQDLQDLIATIVDRAEGVFLWAHLVVEHIRTDADYFPTWKMLVQRVDELPSGLHSMYKAMWERHNGDSDVYRAETASYLNTLLARDSYWNSDQLLMMMLKFSVNVQDNIFKGGQAVSLEFLVHECSRFDFEVQKDDSKQKYHVSRCVSKPINNTNLRMDLMELNARLCDSKLHVKVTSDLHNLAAEQDPATTVTGPVYDIPVDDIDTLFYHDKYLEQPTLDTTETLNYLIERGHLSEQRLDPVNPLRAFLDDDLKPQERAQFDEIDWSPEIDCECFERESRAVIESERRAGNLKAVAPFDGGMQLRKAAKKWWEEVKERV
ncbi:uncharacterized protein CC84DRAFT_1257703 [Paraphaeosphaeria sporulosa]|uniref:Nephrocystin 3-like N-terminal domain-containing protein n=1 Tax=Paraphaeosphaeria sporulosa TaxID=1460663 RepID=A0A177CN74_9PLEO|nr:uncharacterized protein CC84DRAFT_1257703 [Paraphaeosphaeria sporulosa]OAG08963.1 hypothetical protein CC84DRAFT_1257703 [Paraphaeosphaeria sporulosa]